MDLDAKKLLSQPKTYVGSDVCKACHLEHFDAWKMTLHSRMLQDARANADAIDKGDPAAVEVVVSRVVGSTRCGRSRSTRPVDPR